MIKLYLPQQTLLIVNGVPGSGKDSLLRGVYLDSVKICDGLLELCNLPCIDVDKIKSRFTDFRRGEEYERFRKLSYDIADKIAREYLHFGNDVVINSTFSTEVQNPAWVSRYKSMTEETQSRLKIVRCVAPEDVIRRRIEQRDYARDKWKLENWQQHREEEPIEVSMPTGSLVIDTSQNSQKNLESVIDFLMNPRD